MEQFDLYTADRVRTDMAILRGTKIPEGYFRLVVHVCIFSSDGKMLIQKRQPFKHGWAGRWDVSAGGSAMSGDNSRQAAQREAYEEIGVDVDLSDMQPAVSVYFEQGFNDFYTIVKDLDPDSLHLQWEEVDKVRWADLNEILSMIDDGSFIPYQKDLIRLLFSLREKRGCFTTMEGR